MNACITRSLFLGILALVLSAAAFSAQPDELFRTHVYSDTVLVEPGADQSFEFDVDLIVSGPDGFYHRESFPAGSVVEFGPAVIEQGHLPDGTYKYELRIMGTGQQLVRGVDQAETANAAFSSPHSGAFTVKSGSFLSPDAVEPVAAVQSPQKTGGHSSLETDDADEGGARDVVYGDDLIVQRSLCVGFDCVNGEVFGFDTIRLKENNLRIKFEDTSGGAFPTNDWELTANDSANGGLSRFSIRDVDAGRDSFTVEAGARSNALYVESGNDVGFGTANPVLNLHVVDGDSPGLRLEQDGSSGFQAQSWDIAGNETNFFVRDATNGSLLPFRIFPGSASSSLVIRDGDVGVGTASPDASLHVQESNGSAQLLVEETNATDQPRTLLRLANSGNTKLELENTSAGTNWGFANPGSAFRISLQGSGQVEFEVDSGGNLTIPGTLSQGSSRSFKTNIAEVDERSVLERLAGLTLSTWSYKTAPDKLHVGPMAEEFYSVFGLGLDEKHIAPGDLAGISLAAVKQLHNENEQLKSRVARLEGQLEELLKNQ